MNRRAAITCLLLAMASIVIRAICFIQLDSNPVAFQHRWDQSDMHFYDQWARQIAAGDWLQDRPLHPLHDWHRDMARIYLARHPDAVDARSPDPPEQQLWNKWYGQKRFHQEPLYPYFVAALYRIFGHHVHIVFAVQMLVGACTNVLIFLLARKLMGDWPGLVAGLIALGYGPLLYYEILLLREATLVCISAAAMYLTLIALERNSWKLWSITGAVLGAGLLIKTTLAVYVAIVLIAIVARGFHQPRRMAACVFAAIIGIVIPLAPFVARNLIVGAPATDLSSVAAITFINANANDPANKQFGFAWSLKLAPQIMGESGGRLIGAIAPTLKTHDSAAGVAQSLAAKLWWMWNWYEIPNNSNFYYYRLHLAALKWLPITFGLIAAPAIPGMLLGLREMRRWWPIYAMAATNIAVMLIFYVSSRMRIPLVPELILFATLALTQIVRWAREQQWPRAIVATLMVGALGYWTWGPIPPLRPMIRYEDHMVAYLHYYVPAIDHAKTAGDAAEQRRLIEEFLRTEPAHIAGFDGWHIAKNSADLSIAQLFAEAHVRYAWILQESGDSSAGDKQMQRARDLMSAAGKTIPF